jgi:hypothetical protein
MPLNSLSNTVLCRYTFLLEIKHQSLLPTTAGVRTVDLGLHTPVNDVAVFLHIFLHPMLYSVPLFLNVAVLHYNVFTKAVYNQTSNWLLFG